MALFIEDTEKTTKKQIPIPQKAKKMFKAMKKVYEPYLDKPIKGAKILKSLASDKTYNSKNGKLNGKQRKETTVSVEDAKKRLSRQDQLQPNSLEYQLYGGQLAHNILKKGVERARGVQSVDAVKPPKPTTNADLKPSTTDVETINAPNGKVKYTVTAENRIINEGYDDNKFYEYMEEYGEWYVFGEFLSNPKGKQNWGVLINPNMYAKALREFTQYGKLVNFPSKYVYQWMGIIMRNTAILVANTNIGGHSASFPWEDFEDFANSYYDNSRELEFDYNEDKIKIGISQEEVIKICNNGSSLLFEDVSVDKYGQTYFPWIKQSDADRIANNHDMGLLLKKYGDILPMVKKYNDRNDISGDKIEYDAKHGKFFFTINIFSFLYFTGMDDWMRMPDGSDAISDYGIDPLLKIFEEYNDDLPPEKVLVLVNRALDVYHQRGDMASIFITGGSKSLSQISERTQMYESIRRLNGRKIYITENQIIKLWQIQ